MTYEVNFDGKKATVEFSDNLTADELTIVVDTLIKCAENRQKILKKEKSKTLDVNDSFDKLYPPLTLRVRNCLKRADKETINDVLDCTPTEILNIRNLGRKGAEEVFERFKPYGKFREEKAE